MTTRQTSIDEDEFQAFVDGQLTPERCRAVMAYLAGNPDEAARMGDYRAISNALHVLYDEVLYEPLPKRLTIEQYRGRSAWHERVGHWLGLGAGGWVPRLAAVAVLVMVSGAGGWWLHLHSVPQPVVETPAMSFTRQAANAHLLFTPDLRHPVEFGADQQDSLMLWLSERLGQTVHAPNLKDLGFALVGGRLLPASDQAAAQLMYENPDAQRITLYIRSGWTRSRSGALEGTVNFTGDGAVSMVYWIEGPFAYALIGAMDREQLFATAKIIQQQLTLPVVPPPAEQTATSEKNAT